jgi:hypothetical protein
MAAAVTYGKNDRYVTQTATIEEVRDDKETRRGFPPWPLCRAERQISSRGKPTQFGMSTAADARW